MAPVAVQWLLFALLVVSVLSRTQVREVLTISGNFSLNGKFTNLAQYDISTGVWSDTYEPHLYVYGQSNGVLWDTKVNRSSRPGPGGGAVDELLVVGAFDTVSKTSQMLYCSVGIWTGLSFNKVGEGLCPRGGGSSAGMLVQTSALGSDGDLFVGGYFSSRVWDGDKFTDVFNIAYFQGSSSSWLPLKGGRLQCKQEGKCDSRVSALAWDSESRTLFIGGKFNYLGDEPITSGLSMWSVETGLVSFSSDSSSGLSLSNPTAEDGEATALIYNPRSKSLFVAGSYSFVAGLQCSSIAVWHRISDSWTCLDTPNYSISTVTAMCLDETLGALYLAGWASFQAQWEGRDWGSPYAISRINVRGYMQYHSDKGDRNHGYGGTSWIVNSRSRRLRVATISRATRARNQNLYSSHQANITEGHTREKHMLHNNRVVQEKLLHFRKLAAVQNHSSLISNSVRNISSRQLKSDKYKLEWDWLPGFSGGNGPIFSIDLGRNKFKNCLFISGAFNNGPPIVLWSPTATSREDSVALRNITAGSFGNADCSEEACVFPVGWDVNIYGLITTVAQLKIPMTSVIVDGPDEPDYPVNPTREGSPTLYLIFVFSVSIGICLGISITVKCMQNAYEKVPDIDHNDDDINDIYDDDEADYSGRQGRQRGHSVTLGTLSTGGNRTIDLKTCYRRAMEARHLSSDEIFVTINPQDVELITTIGEGSFGTVWAGIWRNNSVAVKEFCFAQAAIHGDSQQSESLVEEIIGEAGIMTCLRHPKILQLYGCSLTPQAVWIVCELCDRGSLRMLLDHAGTTLTNEHKLSLCMDVADGMHYLHRRKKPIIHRDLKSYNIFIIENSPGKYTAKIGDWGSARAVALSGNARSMTQGVGTACWLAPEAIKQSHFSKASDVYSFGIVLWEIYTRRRVHVKLSDSQIIARVANDGLRPEVPVYCSWGELMQRCWDENPSNRPSFKYIVDTLFHIYNQERAEKGSLTTSNLNRHDMSAGADGKDDMNISLQNRRRNFYYSDSSDESRAIGASF